MQYNERLGFGRFSVLGATDKQRSNKNQKGKRRKHEAESSGCSSQSRLVISHTDLIVGVSKETSKTCSAKSGVLLEAEEKNASRNSIEGME